MDQAGRFVGFVLGTRVDSGDDVHQGNGIPLEQEDAQAVVQGGVLQEDAGRTSGGKSRTVAAPARRRGAAPWMAAGRPFRLPFDHVSARVYFILSLRREKAIFVPAGELVILPKSRPPKPPSRRRSGLLNARPRGGRSQVRLSLNPFSFLSSADQTAVVLTRESGGLAGGRSRGPKREVPESAESRVFERLRIGKKNFRPPSAPGAKGGREDFLQGTGFLWKFLPGRARREDFQEEAPARFRRGKSLC